MGWKVVPVLGLALWATAWAASAQQTATEGDVDWDRGCPPNGYPDETGKKKQPRLDIDLDGDGTNDSWITPITIPKEGGGTYSSTDACGNEVCLPAIPDPMGAGCGEDYYSPRLKLGGDLPGEIVGKCHYTYGRNSWKLFFLDEDRDCVPDKFLKITWDSFDGGDEDRESDCHSPTAGETMSYVAEVTDGKVVVTKTKKEPSREAAEGPPGPTFATVAGTITDLGTDPAAVLLEGERLPVPQDAQLGTEPKGQSTTSLAIAHQLTSAGEVSLPGSLMTVDGTIANRDVSSHTYRFSLLGINATVLTDPSSLEVTLAPGEQSSYTIEALIDDIGPAAVTSYAYAETGLASDASLDGVVHPDSWLYLGHAKPGSAGTPYLAGSGTLVPAGAVELQLTQALPLSVAYFVFGFMALDAPFKGGTLVPQPQIVFALPTGPQGGFTLPFVWPGLPPGIACFVQYWIQDPGATHGLSASNALRGTTY